MTWTPDQQETLLSLIQQRNERDVLKRQVAATTAELKKQQQEQARLASQWEKEQADVNRLNRLSWASVFYDLIDQKEQRLTKEEAEAQQARLRYDAVTASVAALHQQQQNQQSRLTTYDGIDSAYHQLIDEKQAAMKTSTDAAYEPYKQQIAAVTVSNRQVQELQEAHTAGLAALDEVMVLNGLLNQARNLGAWDALGGSTFSSIMKYNKLDEVKEQSNQVSYRLQQFRAEYADLNRQFMADWQFDQGVTRFVDIFFDNIFTDWSVQARIRNAHETAQELERQLVSAVTTLKTEQERVTKEARQEADKLQLLLEKL